MTTRPPQLDVAFDPGPPSVGGKIAVEISFLEMTPPPPFALEPARDDVAVVHARMPTVPFYRFLYDTVGEPWLWYERRVLDDVSLRQLIHHPKVEVHVLQVSGVPAGFAELDRRGSDVVDLAYFGLMPEFIGQGLGGWFLRWAVMAASRSGPRRLTVNTCSLDHPHAMALYRSVGFDILSTQTHRIDDPRPLMRR